MTHLSSFKSPLRVVIFGATGGIGKAMAKIIAATTAIETLYLIGRSEPRNMPQGARFIAADITNESQLEAAADIVKSGGPLDMVLIMTGLLHGHTIAPEKSARQMDMKAFEQSFAVNCFGPALIGKHFLPLMHRNQKSVFAALSARIGSISDNRLGGWYAYRASKAALNMILKTLSIEYGRRFKQMVILGLHPGTVDTGLSKPFQSNVPEGKLFTPDYSAERLLTVIDNASHEDSGTLIAWDGQTIPF